MELVEHTKKNVLFIQDVSQILPLLNAMMEDVQKMKNLVMSTIIKLLLLALIILLYVRMAYVEKIVVL